MMDTLPTRRDLVPMSPAFPEAWTHAVAEAAYSHAVEVYPREAAGVVEVGAYQRLDNVSRTPEQDVLLSDADLVRVGAAELFFHSHPDGLGCPSEHDMIYQQQLGIPFVVMVLPHYDVFCFGDMLARAPLIGRGFRHGVHDCYAVMRDWFAEAGMTGFPDQPRGWEWWTKQGGKNLYMAFEEHGFERIDLSEPPKRGDVALFKFRFEVPMHGAVVIDRDLLLQHVSGINAVDATRLSSLVPRARLARHITMALRHRTFTP
jgi:proteasome lid subunit RPN8/RPN11